jgi:peptidoglycan/LPS O-acetylase OafA/YrhL
MEIRHQIHLNYRADIDGLRALAVLSVVGFHAFSSTITGGFVGVDIFFVVSGYLISSIILRNLDSRIFSFASFFSRRILRIFPSLIVVLSACFGIAWFTLLSSEFQQLGKHIAGGAGFISNLLFWNESGYFDNISKSKPLLHLWSLGIEEQFYILWPLIMYVSWKRNLNLLKITISLIAFSFLLNVYLSQINLSADFYSPFTRFWELLSGALLAFITLQNKLSLYKQKLFSSVEGMLSAKMAKLIIRVAQNMLSAVGLIVIIYSITTINEDFIFPGYWAALPVLGTIMVIAAGNSSWLNQIVLSNRVIVWFGQISYPLYLWHWPILSFIYILDVEEEFQYINIYAVIGSIFLAWLTYSVIEKPIRFSRKWRVTKVMSLTLLMLAVGLTGFFTYQQNGLEFRSIAQFSKEIDDAKKDWGYGSTILVDGKIENRILLTGKTENRVLFIGDSIMGMYYPRLYKLYETKGPYYSSLFVARNHCQPVPGYNQISSPENISCTDYYSAAMLLAKEKENEKIVLAGNWIDLSLDNKITGQGNIFVQDIKSLVDLGKEVIIIGSHARHPRFAPRSISNQNRFKRNISDQYMSRSSLEALYRTKNDSLRLIAQRSGAKFINPFNYLCDDNVCPYVIDGAPVYIDADHIRAKYVREKAIFLDDIVNNS